VCTTIFGAARPARRSFGLHGQIADVGAGHHTVEFDVIWQPESAMDIRVVRVGPNVLKSGHRPTFRNSQRTIGPPVGVARFANIIPPKEQSMATRVLAEWFEKVEPDEWRTQVGFSPNLSDTLEKIQAPGLSSEMAASLLSDWLAKFQPCLFGRIAAKQGLITFCFLREEELLTSDDLVAANIRSARLEWLRRGWKGEASAFIIVVLSTRLANAKPSDAVREIARRLCSLYLLRDVQMDTIHWDELFLTQPGKQHTCWKWLAGVNYFSAQADKRLWQDHRIPAGMAFSVNSVGHMARAGRLSQALYYLEQAMGSAPRDFRNPKVESLDKALELAMRTIDFASDAPSGKATMLFPQSERLDSQTTCPVALPEFLANKDYCTYFGRYHTDVTLPSEYFRPEIEWPADLPTHDLDFTYLFEHSLENPDHVLMGSGLQIQEASEATAHSADFRVEKRKRGIAYEVAVANAPLLSEALSKE